MIMIFDVRRESRNTVMDEQPTEKAGLLNVLVKNLNKYVLICDLSSFTHQAVGWFDSMAKNSLSKMQKQDFNLC